MYAIIETGGKQYRASKGDVLKLEKLDADEGAKVSFDTDEGRIVGTLVKYNRKTVNVLTDDGRHYRVTPGLLSAVKDVDSAPQPKRSKKKKRLR